MTFKLKNNYKLGAIVVLCVLMVHAVLGSIAFKHLFNIKAIEIIFAGLLLSVILSYSFDTLMMAFRTIKDSFEDTIDYGRSLMTLYHYAVRIKKVGVLRIQSDIEEEKDPFIREALSLINDYSKVEDIEVVLKHLIESKMLGLHKTYNVLKMIAQLAPAFGLIGTLVGMVGLLGSLDDPTLIAGNMASALVSTLYGALVANFMAVPMMGRISDLIDKKTLYYNMITEGILLIAKNDATRNVFDKMNAMLPDDKKMTYATQNQDERKSRIYELKK